MKNFLKSASHYQQTVLCISLFVSMSAYAHEGGDIGIGINATNNQRIYKDIDHDASLGVHLEYQGERLNIDQDSISYKLKDTDKFQFEVLGKSPNPGYEAEDSKTLKGMDDRDSSLDVGGRVAMKTHLGLLSLDATTDITGTHDGQEVDLRFGPDFYRKHWNGNKEFSLGLLAGAKWQSKDVVDYYYGVKDSEATASRAAYKGKSAVTPYAGIDAQMNLSKRLSLNASAIYHDRPDEITNSPIVDKDQDVELNAGLTYWF